MSRINFSVRDGDGLSNLTSRLLPLAVHFKDSLEQPFRAYPDGRAKRIFFPVHFHVGTAPETSETPFVWKIWLWLRIVNRSVTGVAAIRSRGMCVVQCVARMAEHSFWGEAVIILPMLTEIGVLGMAQERNLGSWKAAGSVQDSRFRPDHQVYPFRHYQRRANFPNSRPRQIAR